MACRNRGMALASVVFVLGLLMLLAMILTDKVLKASRGAAAANARELALSAADTGIEWGRLQLAVNYAGSDQWHNYLTAAPAAGRYPPTPAFTIFTNNLQVELFLRDNPDGDADWQYDNDLRIFMLARVRSPHGPETLVETLCGLTAAGTTAGYRQQTPAPAAAGPDLEPGPAQEFHITD